MFQKRDGSCAQFVGVWLVICAVSAFSAYGAPFITVYETDFEDPPFVPGDLVAQDNWSAVATIDSPATVQTTIVSTGSQAVELERGSGVGTQADANYLRNLSPETFIDKVKVTWDMYVVSGGAPLPFGPFFGMDNFTSPGPTKRVGFAGQDAATGEVLFSTPGTGLIAVDDDVISLDEWHTWEMLMDFTTGSFDVTVDAGLVLDDIDFADPTVLISDFSAAALTTFSGSDDPTSNDAGGTGYFDNYIVMTLPEPASLLLLTIPALLALRRRA